MMHIVFGVVVGVLALIALTILTETPISSRPSLSILPVRPYVVRMVDGTSITIVADDVGEGFQDDTSEAARWLNFTLGPATVALVRAENVAFVSGNLTKE